jgi:sec-independent protein translocase protein TatB
MFDIGMAEMAVIGVVALIVVGPKDLPQMFRKVGQFVGKARGMAREFQRAMEQAADESGVGEISAELKKATTMRNLGLDDATKTFQNYQKNFDPKKVDAAAEHAKRVKAAEDARVAGAKWPPEGVDVPKDIPVVTGSGVGAKSVAPKESKESVVAKKATTKKPAAVKPAETKVAAPKAVVKKAATKSAAPKTNAKKPATKSTKAAESKA